MIVVESNVIACLYLPGEFTAKAEKLLEREAEALLDDREYDVDSFEVLALARDSGCSAYDCEFIALAKHLDVRLVTEDAKLRKAFPTFTTGLPSR